MKCRPLVIFSKRRCFSAAGEARQAFEIWGTPEWMQPVLREGMEEVGEGEASLSKEEEAGCGVISCLLPLQLGR